ncbi:SHOCT domain-containing protein [Desulfitobacterium hafniense]|uniref:SHOCT domain-containing protein n=1 Tax=Desulfitobacterium hafniense TaxID=49338 RepID=UPI0002F46CF7|nr:SHOCT domain-containing protein [Desulfitobacterium hafniense]
MSRDQEANEVKYKAAVKLLEIMLSKGLITLAEYQKIDDLNRQTFTPELAEVYVK